MDKFLNRLKYYGFGFGLGLIFVFLFFQNRGCSWLPTNRVKNSILDRLIVISEKEDSLLKSHKISKDDVINLLNTGDVNFDKSLKEGNTKIYFISDQHVSLYFTLPKNNYISEVRMANKPVTHINNTTKGLGNLLHFPNDENLIYVDSSKILTCQQEELGFINQKLILKSLKKDGKIDFGQSFYFKKPKPIIYLKYRTPKNELIGSQTFWYKNKITIKSFDLPFETSCK